MNKERFDAVIARVMSMTSPTTMDCLSVDRDLATEIAVASLKAKEEDEDDNSSRAALLMIAVTLEDAIRGPLSSIKTDVDTQVVIGNTILSTMIAKIVDEFGRGIADLEYDPDSPVHYDHLKIAIPVVQTYFKTIGEITQDGLDTNSSMILAAIKHDCRVVGPVLVTIKAVQRYRGWDDTRLEKLIDYLYETKYKLNRGECTHEYLQESAAYAVDVMAEVLESADNRVLN